MMPKSMKAGLCSLLTLTLVMTLVLLPLSGCGSQPDSQPQEGGNDTAVSYDGAGDSEKQVAALNALKALTGKTESERLAQLNTSLPTCPFCGKTAAWSAFQYDTEDPDKIASNKMSTDENAPSHFYVYGDKTTVEGNWLMAAQKDAQHYACILLDGNIASEGSILAFFPTVMHVGGKGSISTTTSGQGGLFSFSGANLRHELNLYGGQFYSSGKNSSLESAAIYTKDPDSIVNIWSNDVVIGVDTKPADAEKLSFNIRCGGILNMYAGTIQNGKGNGGDGFEESANLYLAPGSQFNMYGGTIQNGYSRRGGNIYICSADIDMEYYDPEDLPEWNAPLEHTLGNDPVVNIMGGTIQNGYATSNGGGIFNKSAKLSIQGLTLINNTSVITGGNFWTNQSVEIKNTLISGGESTQSHGGNMFISDGEVTLDAETTVENGTAKGRAGNIYVNPRAVLHANGPIVQNKEGIHADLGGNIYVSGGKVYINCLVSGGHSVSGGGNIYVVGNKGLVTLGDCQITGGIDDSAPHGGNINFVAGTLKLSGNAQVEGDILLPNDKNVKLTVEKTFSGDVTIWRDGTPAKAGSSAKYSSCTGKFTGTVKNANGAGGKTLQLTASGKSLKHSSK